MARVSSPRMELSYNIEHRLEARATFERYFLGLSSSFLIRMFFSAAVL